jgi:hypothetical protein
MKAECEHKCRKIQVSPPFSGPEMRNISHFFLGKIYLSISRAALILSFALSVGVAAHQLLASRYM